jgi:predicted RNase H-like HicB family nuclease
MKKTHKKTIKEYIVVFQEENEGGYSVWVPDLPGCASQGETLEEALNNIKEAIELYLEETHNDNTSDHYRTQFVVPVQIYA